MVKKIIVLLICLLPVWAYANINANSFTPSSYVTLNDASHNIHYYEGMTFNDDWSKILFTQITSSTFYNCYVGIYSLFTPYEFGWWYSYDWYVNLWNFSCRDLKFSDDWLKLFTLNINNNKIYVYDLSIAFDVNTVVTTNSYSANNYGLHSISFNNDWTLLILWGYYGWNYAKSYVLPSPYDVTNIAIIPYTYATFSEDIFYWYTFTPDGTRFYANDPYNQIRDYVMSIPWDISTASYNTVLNNTSVSRLKWKILFSKDWSKYVIWDKNTHLLHMWITNWTFIWVEPPNPLEREFCYVEPIKENIITETTAVNKTDYDWFVKYWFTNTNYSYELFLTDWLDVYSTGSIVGELLTEWLNNEYTITEQNQRFKLPVIDSTYIFYLWLTNVTHIYAWGFKYPVDYDLWRIVVPWNLWDYEIVWGDAFNTLYSSWYSSYLNIFTNTWQWTERCIATDDSVHIAYIENLIIREENWSISTDDFVKQLDIYAESVWLEVEVWWVIDYDDNWVTDRVSDIAYTCNNLPVIFMPLEWICKRIFVDEDLPFINLMSFAYNKTITFPSHKIVYNDDWFVVTVEETDISTDYDKIYSRFVIEEIDWKEFLVFEWWKIKIEKTWNFLDWFFLLLFVFIYLIWFLIWYIALLFPAILLVMVVKTYWNTIGDMITWNFSYKHVFTTRWGVTVTTDKLSVLWVTINVIFLWLWFSIWIYLFSFMADFSLKLVDYKSLLWNTLNTIYINLFPHSALSIYSVTLGFTGVFYTLLMLYVIKHLAWK